MINLRRNKRPIFLCKKIQNSTKFNKPIKCNLNYRPANTVGEILTMGEDYSMYLKIKCEISQALKFQNGDKCYVYVNPPKIHDPLCKNADYIVDGSPLCTFNEAEIKLRKLSGNK